MGVLYTNGFELTDDGGGMFCKFGVLMVKGFTIGSFMLLGG